jgi:glucose dehydrogenase
MGEIDTRNTEYDNSIKPMLAARAVLASLVDGMGTPTRSEPVKGVDLYTYGTRKPVQVLWSYDGETHNVPIPRGARALDIWGNPIRTKANIISVGPEPKYFVW